MSKESGAVPMASGLGYDGDSKLCARIDISKDSQAEDLELGEEVTLIVKGKVKRLDGVDQYMSTEYKNGKEKPIQRKIPGHIEIEMSSAPKVQRVTQFDGMMDDD